jgi:RNA polymerase sigma factor (sigma-70 family)
VEEDQRQSLTAEESERFARWWSRLESKLLSMISKYLQPAEARDAAQEVAVSVLLRFKGFPDFEEFASWTWKRARGAVVDRVRLDRLNLTLDAAGVPIPSAGDSSESALLHDIASLVAGLPARQRSVMELTFHGHSDEEIALRLSIEAVTVRSLRRHARARIEAEIERHGGGVL